MNFFVHHFWHWVLGGILIGRVFTLAFNSDVFFASPLLSFFAFWDGGISVYGFVIGFIAFLWKETHEHQFGFWRWIEHLISPLLFLLLVHDISSFTTGNLYGIETSLPWGTQYETFGVETIKPVHPVGLYGFIAHSGLFVWWYNFKKTQLGTKKNVQTILLILLGIDFLLQFVTANEGTAIGGIAKHGQIATFILGLFLARIIWRQKQAK